MYFKLEILHSIDGFQVMQWIEGNVLGAVAPIFLWRGSILKGNSTLITMVSLLFIDSIGNRAKNGIVFDPGNRQDFDQLKRTNWAPEQSTTPFEWNGECFPEFYEPPDTTNGSESS